MIILNIGEPKWIIILDLYFKKKSWNSYSEWKHFYGRINREERNRREERDRIEERTSGSPRQTAL